MTLQNCRQRQATREKRGKELSIKDSWLNRTWEEQNVVCNFSYLVCQTGQQGTARKTEKEQEKTFPACSAVLWIVLFPRSLLHVKIFIRRNEDSGLLPNMILYEKEFWNKDLNDMNFWTIHPLVRLLGFSCLGMWFTLQVKFYPSESFNQDTSVWPPICGWFGALSQTKHWCSELKFRKEWFTLILKTSTIQLSLNYMLWAHTTGRALVCHSM